jgi:hypothetical protein
MLIVFSGILNCDAFSVVPNVIIGNLKKQFFDLRYVSMR